MGKIFDNIESNIEDLIDEVAAAIDDAVDHLVMFELCILGIFMILML